VVWTHRKNGDHHRPKQIIHLVLPGKKKTKELKFKWMEDAYIKCAGY
jgi:hypothetical protein